MPDAPDVDRVKEYLTALQGRLCTALQRLDGRAVFHSDSWRRDANSDSDDSDGGGGDSRVLVDGAVFEKAGVNFSDVRGAALPAAASAGRPGLAGRAWRALGVSVVVHPQNPFVPTTHLNVRFFVAYDGAHDRAYGEVQGDDQKPAAPRWWFGGGFDLTPCYGFAEDARHWHQVARQACAGFGEDVYPRYKKWCDEYFFIQHRGEARGIGGLFFDDLNGWGFARCFAFMQSVGDSFLAAYRPIVERRKDSAYTPAHKAFQRYRRGRYVEFNLVYDRGTLFGLQSGGRSESILMSLPPEVAWKYGWQPPPGSAEAQLTQQFLRPRDWLNDSG